MMEPILSFLPSYFPIIFLAKVKSVNLCFSVILDQNRFGQSDCSILNQIYIFDFYDLFDVFLETYL